MFMPLMRSDLVIATFVEMVFPEGSAGMFVVPLAVRALDYDEDIFLVLAFYRPEGYTRVFAAMEEDLPDITSIDKWKMLTDLGSDWKFDGVVKALGKAVERLQKKVGTYLKPESVAARFDPANPPAVYPAAITSDRMEDTGEIEWQ